jgi:hypothetical protein
MVTSGLTYPIDEDGNELTDENLVYYIESLTANENISSLLSIDDINLASKKLILYPNPANDILNINNIVLEAEILNVLGQSVDLLKNTNSINLSNYKPGIYFLKIKSIDGTKQIYRFIKE